MDTATTYQPEHLDRWTADGPTGFDSAANYAGPDMSHYWKAPVAFTRDADSLATSNWDVVTESILKVAQHDETEIHRMGHWACGWYEILVIHSADTAALQVADQWAATLADYPIADESHWSELQWNTAAEVWESWGLRDRMEACERYGISIMAARRDEMPEDPQGGLLDYLADG